MVIAWRRRILIHSSKIPRTKYKINQCKTATNTICSPVFNFETEKLPKNCPSHLQVGHSTKAHSCFLAGLRSPAFLQKLEGTCGHLRWAGSYWGCWWWCGSWQGCRGWCGSCQAWRWWYVLTSCVMLRSVSLIVQANLLRCSPKKEIVKGKLFQSPRKKTSNSTLPEYRVYTHIHPVNP